MIRKILTFSFILLIGFLFLGGNSMADVSSGDTKCSEQVSAYEYEYTAEEIRNFIAKFNVDELIAGGETARWFQTSSSWVLPTAILPRHQPVMELSDAPMPEIGKVVATTELGTMTLDEFLECPESEAQGFLVIYKGEIAYEKYPGMRETDSHFWASNAKVTASLVIDLLIEDGIIDEQKTLGEYVPEFRGTAWASVPVVDVLDMGTGLNPIDNGDNFADPDSLESRLFRAEFGDPYNGEVELSLDILKDAERLGDSGQEYRYSSLATQALVLLAEAVTNESWSNFFARRVWSKMGVEGPLQVHLSPDGIALAHGPLGSRLRDMGRFAMLYTPSWNKIAVEQVVTPAILERNQGGYRSREFYRAGTSGHTFMERLGDYTVFTAARQWDAIWDEGDFFKSGLLGQGIYVSPSRDLVIVFFSNETKHQIQKYLRPLVTSGLF